MSIKKIKSFLSLFLLFATALIFSGCATLSYTGEDYSAQNSQTVKTDEDFVFSVYKKTINNANIKIGITKSPVPEILALLVQIENLSYETPYVFRVEDLRVYTPDSEVQFITSNNYLSIYQTQEASTMTAMSSMSSTITNMTGMNTNFNDFNQQMVQTASEDSNKSAYSKMEQLGNQILKHSIKLSSTISPRRSQYYYFFFQDPEKYPLTVKYKNLDYQFKL